MIANPILRPSFFVKSGIAPIVADAFFDFAVIPTNQIISASVLYSGSHGTSDLDYDTSGVPASGFYVSTHRNSLKTPVMVNNVVYTGTNSKALAFDHTNATGVYKYYPNTTTQKITVAGFLSMGPGVGTFGLFDYIAIFNSVGAYAAIQLNSDNSYQLNIESNVAGTTHSTTIAVNSGSTYWFSIKTDFANGFASMSLYDASTYALVGTCSVAVSTGNNVEHIRVGQNEFKQDSGKISTFENMVFDWTNAVHPFGP